MASYKLVTSASILILMVVWIISSPIDEFLAGGGGLGGADISRLTLFEAGAEKVISNNFFAWVFCFILNDNLDYEIIRL